MRIAFLFILFLTTYSPQTVAKPVTGDCILFDITFWQKELRLSKKQRSKIYFINYGLYDTMQEMPAEQHVDQELAQMLLDMWRYSINDVLSTRQKKKWKKIIGRYYKAKQSATCE